MAELDILSLVGNGPIITVTVFSMWFITAKVWPWYVDVYQPEQSRRWDIRQAQENRLQEHVNQLSAMIVDITKEYQNGAKSAMIDGFDRICRQLDTSFERQDNRIEGWMTTTAAMVEIVARRTEDEYDKGQ